MKLLILLLATLAAANAMENFFWLGDFADEMGELGRGCCLPTQWEGRVGAVHVTKRFLRPKVRASDSKIGLDFSGKKVAARSLLYCAKTKKTFEVRTVADFNDRKVYFIFKDKCKVFSLKMKLSRPCIPDFFRRFSPYYYGASNSSSLALTAYGYRNGSLSVFNVVTGDSCVPVKSAYRVKRRFFSKLGSYQYYNITLGNRDRDLYTVPDSCDRNTTGTQARSVWHKLKKFVGYYAAGDAEFNPESELTGQVDGDALTQLVDVVDGSAELQMKAGDYGYRREGRDRRWRMNSGDSEDEEEEENSLGSD